MKHVVQTRREVKVNINGKECASPAEAKAALMEQGAPEEIADQVVRDLCEQINKGNLEDRPTWGGVLKKLFTFKAWQVVGLMGCAYYAGKGEVLAQAVIITVGIVWALSLSALGGFFLYAKLRYGKREG